MVPNHNFLLNMSRKNVKIGRSSQETPLMGFNTRIQTHLNAIWHPTPPISSMVAVGGDNRSDQDMRLKKTPLCTTNKLLKIKPYIKLM
jgi:hypothetical protein